MAEQMKQYPIFHVKRENRSYFVGECQCTRCDKELKLNDVVLVYECWRKKTCYNALFCQDCINKHEDVSRVESVNTCIVTNKRPPGSYPILISPPTLSDGRNNATVFSMANENIDGEETRDMTKLAGRESLEGAQIGADISDVDAEKDKVLSADEAEDFSVELQNSRPAINQYDKKMIK